MNCESKIDIEKLREMFIKVDETQLSLKKTKSVPRLIFNFTDNGYESFYTNSFRHFITTNIKSNSVQNLLNYLSNFNIIKKDNEIGFYLSILNPLYEQLDLNEIENAINKTNEQPSILNDKQLLEVVNNQIELCINKKNGTDEITLISPVCQVEMPNINEIILIKNDTFTAKIRKWSKRERLIFSSIFHNSFEWDHGFKKPMDQEFFVEISYKYKDKPDLVFDDLKAELFKIYDLIKWSLIIVTKNPTPISEGTCIIRTKGSQRFYSPHRDGNICGGHIIVKKDMAEKAKKLINDFYLLSNEYDDLLNALMYFGRACIANLERDKLIDSVFGLENLLVNGHDQLSYQFRLHGATILSTRWEESKIPQFENENCLFGDRDKLIKWFNKLYGERSKSVHGSYNESNKYAESALYGFSYVIEGIIYLFNEGLLNTQYDNIAIAVQNYVIKKAVIRHID